MVDAVDVVLHGVDRVWQGVGLREIIRLQVDCVFKMAKIFPGLGSRNRYHGHLVADIGVLLGS